MEENTLEIDKDMIDKLEEKQLGEDGSLAYLSELKGIESYTEEVSNITDEELEIAFNNIEVVSIDLNEFVDSEEISTVLNLKADDLELIDLSVEQFHNSVEEELRAKIKSLTIANETATFLFRKILKGFTFNSQIKQWLELNKVRE